jgi:hypothetical protein
VNRKGAEAHWGIGGGHCKGRGAGGRVVVVEIVVGGGTVTELDEPAITSVVVVVRVEGDMGVSNSVNGLAEADGSVAVVAVVVASEPQEHAIVAAASNATIRNRPSIRTPQPSHSNPTRRTPSTHSTPSCAESFH